MNGRTLYEDYHKEMINRSLISIGNNVNMKKAMRKAKNGEKITIAYLGGSITMERADVADSCFAISSYRYFKDNFVTGNNVNYVNAGMNGTSSLLGLIRVERDVLQYNPDIVFVEFAVNDSKDSLHREAFESLIIRLLQSDIQPAVVMIFVLSEAGYSCQSQMQVIGEYYDLPMISVGDAIRPEIAAERMTWADYSNDNIHPNRQGHTLVTEFIANYYEAVAAEQQGENFAIPEKHFYGNSFVNMKMLDSRNVQLISAGSYVEKYTINEFKYGWIHTANERNDSFTMKLTCKYLFIVYAENNDENAGDAEVYVDGILKSIMSGFRILGWNNPAIRLVFQEDISKEHTIKIKMSKGDETKSFNILAFGYSEE